jgi:hypothetical protein
MGEEKQLDKQAAKKTSAPKILILCNGWLNREGTPTS